MASLVRTAVTVVYLVLVIGTGLSWSVAGQGLTPTVVIMTVGFAKAFMIGLFFMELLHAPRFLQGLLALWCVLGWAGILAFYA
ncbi:MAG: cytochrome C oxidase subunit IV family protein [candidate division KSB1 bacterium]|nr:cytochrome C oxidase subunit IV family protein [candidate division KSB1 bacterium]